MLAFGFRGDPTWRDSYARRPILNPVETIFNWLGVGIAKRQWLQFAVYRLLLLWLGKMVIPALLASHAAPSSMRMTGAGPAVCLLTRIGRWEAFEFVRRRSHNTFSFKVNITLGVAIGALIAAQGMFTFLTYFHKWADSPEVYKAHRVEWAMLAHTLNDQPSTGKEIYLLPYRLNDHYSFEYLYQGPAPAHVIRSSPPQHVGKQLESALVKIVDRKDHVVWSQ